MSSTCFEHPSVHPQEDLYMQFYGISFIHPYKQSGGCQDVFDTETRPDIDILRTNTRMFETCRRHYNLIKSLKQNVAFCWFLLHMYITMHGSRNVKHLTE